MTYEWGIWVLDPIQGSIWLSEFVDGAMRPVAYPDEPTAAMAAMDLCSERRIGHVAGHLPEKHWQEGMPDPRYKLPPGGYIPPGHDWSRR